MPILGRLLKERKQYMTYFPPGHFSNPFIDPEYIIKHKERIFDWYKPIGDIDLNAAGQFELIQSFAGFYEQLDLPVNMDDRYLYYMDNTIFPFTDGIMLACVMNEFRPQRIIESGSGFSSALMLDMNHKYFSNKIQLTFIDPYPDRLRKLLPVDVYNALIVEKDIQDVELELFDTLNKNDILFLDSTHIVKTGGDINYWLFEILPRLKPGVIIHIHDIFYPFEYDKEWVLERKSYTEAYLVRAFLMNNTSYKILLFNSYVHWVYNEWLTQYMPLCTKPNTGSLWLMKTDVI